MELGTQSVVLLTIVNVPKFLLGVIRVCVQPLLAFELMYFLFKLAICTHEVVQPTGSNTPNTDIEERLWAILVPLRGKSAEWRVMRLSGLA